MRSMERITSSAAPSCAGEKYEHEGLRNKECVTYNRWAHASSWKILQIQNLGNLQQKEAGAK